MAVAAYRNSWDVFPGSRGVPESVRGQMRSIGGNADTVFMRPSGAAAESDVRFEPA